MTASKIEIHKVCEYCGKTFVAWKSTTRFCSKTCNSRAYKQLRREQRVAAIEKGTNIRPIEKIKDKTILSPKEVAVLLGLSTRNVYYLIDKGLLKASHLSTRITLIKRNDIEVMLDANLEKRKRQSIHPITEFYTTAEILDKYGISDILNLTWDDIQLAPDLGYCVRIRTQKTDTETMLPIRDEALQLCGEHTDGKVFRGLIRSMVNYPLRKWIAAAGIKKHISFHLKRRLSPIALSQLQSMFFLSLVAWLYLLFSPFGAISPNGENTKTGRRQT